MTPSNSIRPSLVMRLLRDETGRPQPPRSASNRFQIGCRTLASPRIAFHVEADLLALMQIADARPLDGRDVHEHILRAVFRLDEAEALLGVEPFYGADRHRVVFHVARGAAGRDRAVDRTSVGIRDAGPALLRAKAACRGSAASRYARRYALGRQIARIASMPSTATDRAAVIRCAREWLHTPYYHTGRAKGAGVDCATLLADIYAETGLVAPLTIPHYPPDWHLH